MPGREPDVLARWQARGTEYAARMSGPFAKMLTGGHPNSLGRTEEVVGLVLADRARLEGLFATMSDPDEVVRLRVGDALEKVCREQPGWFVLNVTMDVLTGWAQPDPRLAGWLAPELERLAQDDRASVAGRASRRLAEVAG